MFTETKKSSSAMGGTFHVFSFVSEKEFEEFKVSLKELSEILTDNDRFKHSKNILIDTYNKANTRCDDKYANDKVACSFLLFNNELLDFVLAMFDASAYLISAFNSERKLCAAYDNLLEKYQEDEDKLTRIRESLANAISMGGDNNE